MQVYYTTSVTTDDVQKDPKLSVGGYRSGTVLKNDDFSNLFGEISSYTISKNRNEYAAMVLKNTSGSEVTGVEIWVDYSSDPYTKYEIALVTLVTGVDGELQMERVADRYTKPFTGTFEEALVGSKKSIGTIPINGVIGIWVRRVLDIDFIIEDCNDVYEEDPDNLRSYLAKEKDELDTINIQFSWD